MPGNTDRQKAQRKRDAVRSVVIFSVLQLFSAAVCLCVLVRTPGLPGWGKILLTLLAAGCILALPGAVAVLRQRFREIEGGELDDAGQY